MPNRFLTVTLLPLWAGFAATAGHIDLEYSLVARSAGPVRTVAIQGDHAYAGVGHQLWVFDISQAEPVLVFESDALPNPVEALVVHDHYAFLAAGRAGLFIYDIANPASATLVSSLDTPGFALDLAVTDNNAYVAARRAGLRVIDISTIGSPLETDVSGGGNFPILSVDILEDDFIATFYPRGFIAPVGGGTAPRTKRLPPQQFGIWQRIAARNGYAYIAAESGGLRIFDISPIHDTHEVGFFAKQGPEDAFDVTLANALAFVADRTVSDGDELYRRGGLRIVDVSDPTAPAELGNLPGDVWSVAVDGTRAVVADYTRGRTRNTSSLDIVDIADPAKPTRVASFTVPPEIKPPMVSVGTSVYIVDTHLRRFDLSDPEHPRLAWSLALPRDTYFRKRLPGLAVFGTHAYVGGGTAGLHVVDLSDPDQPAKVTTLDIEAYDVTAETGRVYASELFGGLSIVDITNPATPSVVGALQGNFSVGDMEVADNVLYIAPYPGASLIIYDLSDAAMPALLGYYGAGETIHHVELGGAHAFLAVGDTEEHIEVVDISDPSQSQFVSEFHVAYPTISDMTIAGDLLYLTVPAAPGGGLRVLDISNPSSVRRQGNYKMRVEFAYAVSVLPGNIVALGSSSGLMVLRESEAVR